eukprot:2302147-Pleurochrysis_carterae.AAC.1
MCIRDSNSTKPLPSTPLQDADSDRPKIRRAVSAFPVPSGWPPGSALASTNQVTVTVTNADTDGATLGTPATESTDAGATPPAAAAATPIGSACTSTGADALPTAPTPASAAAAAEPPADTAGTATTTRSTAAGTATAAATAAAAATVTAGTADVAAAAETSAQREEQDAKEGACENRAAETLSASSDPQSLIAPPEVSPPEIGSAEWRAAVPDTDRF